MWAEQEFRSFRASKKKPIKEKLNDYVDQLTEDKLLYKVDITACVVWDTVSALGLPTQLPPRPLSFAGRKVPRAVKFALQALALDEKRAKFKPHVWDSREDQRTCMKQCLVLGPHGDIGGNNDAALGALTLIWVIGQLLNRTGVTFDEAEITKHLKHRLLE